MGGELQRLRMTPEGQGRVPPTIYRREWIGSDTTDEVILGEGWDERRTAVVTLGAEDSGGKPAYPSSPGSSRWCRRRRSR